MHQVTVTAQLVGRGYEVRSTARGHTFASDLAVDDHGADGGPNPEELLLGALGACTIMTLQMYALRKEWPLEGVEIELSYERIAREDCADCPDDTPGPKVDRIARHVRVSGPLDASQLERLLQIANRCPVHRILTGQPVIVTELVAG